MSRTVPETAEELRRLRPDLAARYDALQAASQPETTPCGHERYFRVTPGGPELYGQYGPLYAECCECRAQWHLWPDEPIVVQAVLRASTGPISPSGLLQGHYAYPLPEQCHQESKNRAGSKWVPGRGVMRRDFPTARCSSLRREAAEHMDLDRIILEH